MIMILAISPDHFQPWIGRTRQMLQDVGSGYGIVQSCTADKDDQQQPQDIDTDVAFASLDLLAASIATLAPLFGRLHRLTIDTGGTWRWLFRRRLLPPDLSAQRVHHALPRAIVSPLRNVVIDGALGQQVVWQHVPLAPGAIEVQDSVDDFAHVHRSRSPAGLRWGKKRLQDIPLSIG